MKDFFFLEKKFFFNLKTIIVLLLTLVFYTAHFNLLPLTMQGAPQRDEKPLHLMDLCCVYIYIQYSRKKNKTTTTTLFQVWVLLSY